MSLIKTNTTISLKNEQETQNKPKEFLAEPKPVPNRNNNYIKEIIVSAADESTTHGIDHFFKREHPFIRLVWAVCFFASAGVCFYMITISIMNYLDYETVTKAEQVNQQTVDFPTVSICNVNPYLTNKSWEYVQSILMQNGIMNSTGPDDDYMSCTSSDIGFYRFLVGVNAIGSNLTDDDRKSFGYNIYNTILSCEYNANNCSIKDDFIWYYDFMYGNCFRYNSGKYQNGSIAPIKKSSKGGSLNGLSIEMFLFEPDNPLALSTDNGAIIFVHNKTEHPSFYDGLGIASGTKAGVLVDREFSYHLEHPYSDCIKDIDENYPSTLVKTMIKNGITYTQNKCFLACFQEYVFENCGCYDAYAREQTGVPDIDANSTDLVFCANYTQNVCDSIRFSILYSGDIKSVCGSKCPLECESVKYNMYTSASDYPSKAYFKMLMQNPFVQAKYTSNPSDLTYDSLKRNLVQISVYYGDLGYQKFDETEKMSITDLISNIGGTLGLFLGMSFLSFMEIIDVLLQIIFYKRTNDKITPNF